MIASREPRDRIEDVYPLSPMQQGMLFHTLYSPGTGAYLGQASWEIRGELDIPALRAAWQSLVDRHPILRTAIFWERLDEPTQVVCRNVDLPWEDLDWRSLPAEEQPPRLWALLDEGRRLGFDLEEPPLMRMTLIHVADNVWWLAWTYHHLLIDGWCMALLFREVLRLYEGKRTGREPHLRPSRPYRDYIAWLKKQDLSRAEAFWRRLLAGYEAPTSLKLERPRRNGSSTADSRGVARFHLAPGTTERLRTLAQQSRVTLNTVAQGAWGLLLSRYSGSDDVVFGATVAGRPASLPGVETMIGPFINTLPVRVSTPPSAELVPWLKDLQSLQVQLREYEYTPLVDLQGWSEVPRSQPLFESVFVFQSFPVDRELLQAVDNAVEIRDLVGREWTSEGLVLSVFEDQGGLSGVLEYDVHAFDRLAVQRLLGQLGVLLGEMERKPHRRLSDLELLSDAERHQIVAEWNDTQTRWPWEESYQRAFEAQVEARPDEVAAVCEGQSLTYGELNARANRMAWRLLKLGVSPDTVVPLLGERGLDFLAAILGVLKAGGAYLPLDPMHPAERWARILEGARVPLIVRAADFAERFEDAWERLPEGSRPRVLGLEDLLAEAGREDNPPCRVGPLHLGYSIFTSGSTGVPKGPMIGHLGFLNHLYALISDMGLTERDRIGQTASQCFDISVWQLLGPLLVGGRVCIFPDEVARDGRRLLEESQREGVTVLEPVPSLLRLMLEELEAEGRQGELGALRWMMPSGEALPEDVARRWMERFPGIPLLNAYGPAECSDDVSLRRLEEVPEEGELRITIGRPVANVRLHVLDRELRPVPIGVLGELAVGGDCVGRGYLNDPRRTAESFLPDPFASQPGARLYRSGDLARSRPDGDLEYLGRIDHQVKVRGFRVELGEVEAELTRQPGVEQAVAAVRADLLVAYVVPQSEGAVEVAQLKERLRASLPEYMVPGTFVLLSELPLTPNGKIDRKALPVPEPDRTAGEAAPLRTVTEQMLAGLWEEVLQLERVGRDDDFFALGGHSLVATRVLSRVRETFGVDLPLRALFESSTLSALAATIEQASSAGVPQAPAIGRAHRDLPLPLSFSQQRLWFIDQLEPESPLYNIASGFRLLGPLDPGALAGALEEVVRRHEVLRTTFPALNGVPVQGVSPEPSSRLSEIDLSRLPVDARAALVSRLAREEARRPFDLARGPLLRATLLRLGPDEHVVLFTLHHAISDGWSMDLLAGELGAFYSGLVSGRSALLPELPVQYADFSVWQRQWLSGDVLAGEVSYWRRQLAGVPPVLELPTDCPRPAVQSFRGAVEDLSLPKEIHASLVRLARSEGATLFMVLLAAFQTLLSRYSGQEDLAVGSPISGRSRLETEKLIGFFVNTLVLRGDLRGDPSFRELLARTREAALGADLHQHLPFETLVQELGVERSLSHSPLFQVMLVLDNTPASELSLPGLSLETLEIESGVARFDLTVSLVERHGILSGVIEYDTDLFDRTTVLRLAWHFRTLLRSVAEAPGSSLSELPLLSKAELQQLSLEWNDTAEEDGTPWVHKQIAAWAELQPEATALAFGERSLSYGELDRLANRLAHRLQRLGAGPEQRVGICMERSLEMVVAVLGVLKAGAAYVPLDPGYPRERLTYMLEDSRPAVLLTQEPLDIPESRAARLVLDNAWTALAGEREDEPAAGIGADSPAYVIYTSGSTGRPKGTEVRHAGLRNLAFGAARIFAAGPGSRVLQLASPSFDASVKELVTALCTGATLCLASREDLMPGAPLARVLREQEITHLIAVASSLAAVEEEDFPALRLVVSGGEVCSAKLAGRWSAGRKLLNVYGPTEATVWATWSAFDGAERPPIGRPIPGLLAYVLSRELRPLPIGVAGELCLGGSGLARGYLARPGLTAERFVPDPFAALRGEPGARLYRTGDRVRLLRDGRLDFLGRLDHQVKIRGFRIEPGEIEDALRRLPAVAEAAVAVRGEGTPGGARLVGYVVPRDGEALDMAQLGRLLRAELPEHMVPAAFVVLAALPLTPGGKVDRQALPAPEPGRHEGGLATPRTPTEELLAGLWAQVLGLADIGVEEDFFALGGHSLLATQLVSRVRQVFAVELPVRSVFESPTVAAMAAVVERLRRAGAQVETPPLERISRDGELSLSFAQQRLWLLDQLDPGNRVYNIPAGVRLSGSLSLVALRRTLKEIVRRHEALRTSFPAVEGLPVQRIAPAGLVDLPLLDLAELPGDVRASELRRLAREEARRPFDLAHGPVLRVRLLRLGETDHVALLTMHHIVSDEWSIGLLIREVVALYTAFSSGAPSPLPALPLQYADFAHWQRRWLSGPALDAELSFWKRELAGAPAVLELPTDRPRPPVQTLRAVQHPFTWPAGLSHRVRELARREGATLFMTLLAAFQALLSRSSGRDNLTVGTPIAGRNRLEIEELIGFFVNTLVLSADFSGEPSFREALVQARERVLAAHDHQDLPFEMLVSELQPERSLAHSPLFQVMFALQNALRQPLALPGLELSEEGGDTGAGQFDLVLLIAEGEERLAGSLKYNPDLFDASTVGRIAEHLRTLLDAAVAAPETPLALLPLLTPAERQQLLEEWNDTGRPGQGERCVHQLFEDQVRERPGDPALIFEDRRLSFAELNGLANRLAWYLRDLGAGPGILVAVHLERSVELAVALLAVFKAGGIYVPLDPAQPEQRLSLILEETGAPLRLTTEHFAGLVLPGASRVLCLDREAVEIAARSEGDLPPIASPDDLAYVIYTSGSTGLPKGALLAHRGLANLVLSQRALYRVRPGDRVLQFHSPGFDGSISEVFLALASGATLCMASRQTLMAPEGLADLLRREEVTVAKLPPSVLNALPEAELPALRAVGSAGDACTGELVARWSPGRRFYNGYGPTEVTVGASMMDCTGLCDPRPPIGRPFPNTQIHLLDRNLQIQPIGIPGELCVGGIGLAWGYLGRPDLTAEKFIPDAWHAAAGDRLYRTGDLARHLPDGRLEFLGRVDRQVKVRGFRIELGEVEAALSSHPAVREAVVVLHGEGPGDKRLAAYLVTAGEAAPAVGELRTFLAASLPDYMIPSSFTYLRALPLTPNGKVDRRALPEPGRGELSRGEAAFAAPRNPLEEVLANLWAEVLNVPAVGIHHDFFNLGGHSLIAAQLISRVRQAFQVEIPLRALFDEPTVAGLARVVEGAVAVGRSAVPPIERVPRDTPPPLSFAQQRLWFLEQMGADGAAYNMPVALRIRGPLEIRWLAAGLAEVVRRHEVLRTAYEARRGEPVQVISPPSGWDLPLVDLGALPGPFQDAETLRRAADEAGFPFNLARGPILRVALLRLAAEDHALLLTLHHIASDGTSIEILVREVSELYRSFASGRAPRLRNLPVQYADFAAWQRSWLRGEVLESELAYWRESLRGAPPVLDLPTDRPRPAQRTSRGGSVPVQIPASAVPGLQTLARCGNATPFMVLLAVFETLLHRLTGEEDLNVGSPIAGRNHLEIEDLIGFFVNTLVLRADLSGDPPFEELVRRAREVVLQANLHQELPFEKLVEELHPERSLFYTPLFQVLFSLQSFAREPLGIESLTVTPLPLDSATAKFELMMILEEEGEGIAGVLEYSSDLFDRTTALRIARSFERLAEAVAAAPGLPLSVPSCLDEVERHQIVVEWNAVPVTEPESWVVHHLFEAQALRTPDAVALVFEGGELSYAELNRRADRLAGRLWGLGVRTERPVLLFLERCPEMVVATLAVLKAGGFYVPLDPAYPQERLAWMLADAGAAVLLTQRSLLPLLPGSGAETLCLDDAGAWQVSEEHEAEIPATGDQLAYAMYTSGSTGRPKGVAVPHRAIVRLVREGGFARIGPDDVFLQFAPTSFDASTLEIWGPLVNGGRLVLYPGQRASLAELARNVQQHGVTLLWLTAGLFHQVVEQGLEAFGSVRHFLAGGDVLSVPHVESALRELPGTRLINGYGPTENTTFTACHRLPGEGLTGRSVPIGRPIHRTWVRLLDREFRPVPIGVAGELYTGGSGLARGYLNRPELTAERFVPDPLAAEPGERLYRTGDLARYLPDGSLEFLGRRDLQIKIRGFRVELGEVEAALAEHPLVQEVAVVLREDGPDDKRLVAYWVAGGRGAPEAGELHDFLAQRLPAYMIPARFVALAALPLSPNGKVDRRALPAPLPAEGPRSEAMPPRTWLEELLAGMWAEVLKVDSVGAHDSFFDLGGHSLLATRVMSRIRQELGIELPLRVLFEEPTVAGLARVVEERLSSQSGMAPPLVPVERGDIASLSFAQERLWLIDQLEPGSKLYNIPAVLRLPGGLRPEVLERALSEVVRRHEALRTTFWWEQGEPAQVIAPAAAWVLPQVDLSALPDSMRESEAGHLASIEAAIPFDLTLGPLLRTTLLRLGGEEMLLLTLHHIVSDGWSMGVLERELLSLYEAFSRREASPLPELPVQYADFAIWQREWLSGADLERQLDFWREHLAGAPAVLDLPTDRPRPATLTYRGGLISLCLDSDLSAGVKALGRREGATLFMVLLGSFAALLSRITDQPDVVLGSPIANRNRVEIEGLIGFFVNTLVLRTDVSGEPTFRDLLGRVRKVMLEAYAHQDLPFERLVDELQVERSLSHAPLFQVMLVLQNTPGDGPSAGQAGEIHRFEQRLAKFALTLTVDEVESGLRLGLEYSSDLFDGVTIERLLRAYERLLGRVAAFPGQRVGEVAMLGEAERHQVRAEWNDTDRSDLLGEPRLHRLVELQAQRDPEAVAVVFGKDRWSYGALNRQANRLAHRLRRLGVGPETCVGLLTERCPEMVAALLGILKAGGAYVPLDPSYPANRLAFMLEDAGVEVLLAQPGLPVPVSGPRVLPLDERYAEEPEEDLPDLASPDNTAYVIYTSGSTGRPKGVMVPHRGACNRLLWAQDTYRLDSRDAVLQKASIGFDFSVWECFAPLLAGARLVLAAPGGQGDPAYLVDAIGEHGVTFVHFTPSMLSVFLEQEGVERCAATLRQVFSGGEALSPELRDRFLTCLPVPLDNQYGPTEASIDLTRGVYRSDLPAGANPDRVAAGRVIANVRAYVADRDFGLAPPGVPGELLIGGVGLARGYLDRPELTADRFRPDPFGGEPGGRLYRTGDRFRHWPDGRLEFLGRLDHQIKLRGFRIELGEIESALMECAGVQEAVALVREDLPGGRGLVGFVEPAGVEIAVLRSSLKERLPDYMVPSVLVALEALPRTPNGKIDRQALSRRPILERGQASGFAAPRPGTEELIAEIWSEVLEIEQIGREDNFFDHGGHSLLATQVVSRISQVLGVELPLRTLFREPTVAGLAEAVEETRRSAQELTAPPIRTIPRGGSLPLSFAQERLWFIDQLQPSSSMYLMPSAQHLPGGVRSEVLERVLAEVLRRHEALRTTFQTIDGLPVQVIAPPTGWLLPQVDLSALPGPVRESEAQRLASGHASRPFDLSQGPLLRTTLLRLGGEEILLLNMHHIVSDAWSMRVLEWEVEVLYEAFSRGEASPLPELPVQYADFAHWQRSWLSGAELERQLDFWRSHLAGAPSVLDLPTDRPRSAVQSYRGAARLLALSPEVSAGLKMLSRQEQSTLFMVVLGSFAILLSRYTSQDDVVVGSPIANRNRAEIEGLIGFFVNTMVLRTDLSGDLSFRQLLSRVRQLTLEAYAHQDLPFERLVSELQVERSLFYTPLFQVMVSVQNTRAGRPSANASWSPVQRSQEGAAKFDLTLGVEEGQTGLVVGLAYSRELFDSVTIERLLRGYECLLGIIAASPEQHIREMPVLGETERHQLQVEWNDTARAHLTQDLCLHQLFERQAERTPAAVALVFDEARLSYTELNRKANRLAHRLRRMGVGPEVRVGVLLDRSPEMVAGLLGILKAGGAYVPLDPAYPADRLAFMIEDAGIEVLLTQERLSGTVVAGPRLLQLDAEQESIAEEPGENLSSLASSGNLAYLIYTSGSTGRPKGVAIEHHSSVELLSWAGEIFSAEELQGVLASTSISFDLSVFELFLPLSRGGKVVLAESALALPSLVAFEELTLINTVPSAMAALVSGALPPKLRTVNLAGEALEAELVRRIHAHPQVERVVNLYGPSEDTTYSTFAVVERGSDQISIGHPVAGTHAYVVDAHGALAPVGVAGELFLSGAGLARGYLGRPELTAARFVPDPFGGRPGAWMYRTGDRCRSLPDGSIEFLGRFDHQIKLRGFRIELGEIETALSQQKGVDEAAAVMREDLPGGRGLVAYVAPAGAVLAELRSSLKGRLPDYMVPSVFIILEALPRMPNGKVDRRALAERPVVDWGGDGFLSPRTEVEELIAGIWSEVLGVERIGVESNFFALGGHSLLATQVMSRIRQVFATDLPLRSLFQDPTVAGLAQAVEDAGRSARELILPPVVPVQRERTLPLSFAQERLWFLDQLDPGSPLYNISASLPLAEWVQPTTLERALSEVVRRHEALRTTFRTDGNGQPEQVIAPALAWLLPQVDLSDLPTPLRDGEARHLAADAGRPFDLSRGPLLRTTLLRLDAEQILLLNMHHIVSDGWSMRVLEREVTVLYEAFSRGEDSPLPELSVQYADLAVWQRTWLSGAELERQLAFWCQHLAGAPALLELPTDRPRPVVQSYRGALRAMALSPELSAAVKALGRREGATLFMVLLGSFAALLSRYTGQEDVVVGSPIANRHRGETEGLIGFFVNTLALRTDLSGAPNFRELLGRVRQVALEAYAHQDLPFERLVEELQVERSLSHSPLFQVMLVLQNTPGGQPRTGDRADGIERSEEDLAKFDMTLTVAEEKDGLRLVLQYGRDLFDGVTMERLLYAYEHLLGSIVAAPGQPVGTLPVLGAAERHQSLIEWNDTAVPYQPVCLHELFRAQAKRTPMAVAASFGEEELTYAELGDRAGRLTRRLRGLGVGPEAVVGVYLERSLDLLVSLFGVLEAGGAYLPLAPDYPRERLAWMIEDARPAVLLAHRGLVPDLPAVASLLVLDPADLGDEPALAVETGAAGSDPANLAYVLFTSGSTGRPKGVMISHGAIANRMLWMLRRFPFGPDDRVLQKTPFSFDASVWELFLPLACGARVVLAQPGGHQDSAYLVQAVQRYGVTVLQLVPSMLRIFLEEEDVRRCTSLQRVFAGGEALPKEVCERFDEQLEAELCNLYGPTEVSIDSSFWPFRRGELRASVPIGRPLDNLRTLVLDRVFQPVPVGAPGELYVSGVGLARGYVGRPDLTAERFLPDPWSVEPGARLYRTGDRVRHGADGLLEFLGRADHQVKIRGFRIEPGEIEAALADQPGIESAVVLVRDDLPGGPGLVAYFVAEEGTAPSAGELRRALRDRLPDYMVPSLFVELGSLPFTPSGKLDRRALFQIRPEVVRDGASGWMPPRDMVELELLRIWEDLLGVRPVGVAEDFFDLGGHSLLAVRLFARIEASFGCKLPLALLFQVRTVERLAATLRKGRTAGPGLPESPLVAIQPGGDRPPFFCVHAVGGSALSYALLAHQLGSDQPFYGLQAQGLDGGAPSADGIEEMASRYVEAIREVQSSGPYCLGGWSMGGLVAYEMARQLRARGEEIALLAMIDTPIPAAEPESDLDRLAGFALDLGLPLERLGISREELAARDREQLLSDLLKWGRTSQVLAPDLEEPHLRRLYAVYEANLRAVALYQPRLYDGLIAFFKAAESSGTHLGWERFAAGGVEVRDVPGGHYSLVREPEVRGLASKLGAALAAVRPGGAST
jgi:amino acid adenylation domain-containing protein